MSSLQVEEVAASPSPGDMRCEPVLPRPVGSPTCLLVITILLSLLLDPAFLLTQGHQDLPSVEPNSSLNVKFDPKKMQLTWDCKENTTSGHCVMTHKEKGQIKKQMKRCQCTFQDNSLHGGVTLTVEVYVNQRPISETLVYTNPGKEGTAAQNFSCLVYNADFMNCTWAKGHAAPDDVQYFLYIRNSTRKGERECPHYLTDAGTNVGCHLQDLSGLTSYNYFLVNGTSRETGIQFFDSILLLKEIERYSPPHNITVNCNESHCLVRWEKPRTRKNWSNREFQYQLDIWRRSNSGHSENQLIVVSGDSENRYNFPSPEPRGTQMVKIRTADARRAHWGDWSQPVQLGSEEPESSLVLVYVLVVLGTLAGGLACGCLFKRFLGSHSLFPPIPRIRDKLKDDHQIDHQILSEKFTCDAEMGDKEEILTVTEVAEAPASP